MGCFFFYWRSDTIEVEVWRMKMIIIGVMFLPFFYYHSWKDRPHLNHSSFWKSYIFFWLYLRLLLIISILGLGMIGLGLVSIQKIAFSIGFLILSILGLLLYSFFLFDIYRGIRTLTQLKMKVIDT